MAADKSREVFWCQVIKDLEIPLGSEFWLDFVEKHDDKIFFRRK